VQFDPMQNLPQPKIKSGKMICLRPKKDFIEFNAVAPDHLEVHYLAPDKSDLIQIASDAQALLIPAVGPKISNDLFSKTSIKFVQVTGAGIDRLDRSSVRIMKLSSAMFKEEVLSLWQNFALQRPLFYRGI
jgi:hypothetical protein